MTKINKENEAAMPQKLLHELLNYDRTTGGWVWLVSLNRKIKVGQPAGCLDKSTGYVVIRINGYKYKAHRLAWTYVYGDYPKGEQPYIDHIDGNPSNNRIVNLKVSSGAENMRNQKKHSRNTSGVTGVSCVSKWNGTRTKRNWYWRAKWQDENGKLRQKLFPIHRLGEEVALQLAINHRAEQIRLLELTHNIVYSNRHGT